MAESATWCRSVAKISVMPEHGQECADQRALGAAIHRIGGLSQREAGCRGDHRAGGRGAGHGEPGDGAEDQADGDLVEQRHEQAEQAVAHRQDLGDDDRVEHRRDSISAKVSRMRAGMVASPSAGISISMAPTRAKITRYV